jgi:starvation-inducible DNA-binding protein
MDVNTGISDSDRKEVAAELLRLLGDTYATYLKTHGYHWNITGPMFRCLHLMFEEQYVEMWEAVDVIAERIRALGYPAPGSAGELARLTSIPEDEGGSDALQMVRRLVEANESVIQTARGVAKRAEAVDDLATADLATARLEAHEKTAWMLRATVH